MSVDNLAAVLDTLRRSPLTASAFSLNEMAGLVLLHSPLPVRGENAVGNLEELPRPLRDTDITAVLEWLQRSNHLPRASYETTSLALRKIAAEHSFHPVRDYLSGLTWDGDGRLDRWLSVYLGVEDTAYASRIGAMFPIAMVARIFSPGSKVDHLLVLEGVQGAGKSTACRILGGEWFSDALPDVTSGKDVSQHLRGKWLIEISELSALSRAEDAHLKAFLTRTVERYRPPYARTEVVEPRQCVFIGSTNKTTYLRDETGGRRYWPVRVGKADLVGLTRDRDQLFAEAVHRFKSGESWWPDAQFEAAHIRPQQQARFEEDPWEEKVIPFLHKTSSSQIYLGRLADEILGLGTSRLGTRDRNRLTTILERSGWRRGRKDSDGLIPFVRSAAPEGQMLH